MNPLFFIAAAEGEQAAAGQIASVVTEQMLNGVLNEVISLLPVCMPVMITFLGIRKGIAFVRSILASA